MWALEHDDSQGHRELFAGNVLGRFHWCEGLSADDLTLLLTKTPSSLLSSVFLG